MNSYESAPIITGLREFYHSTPSAKVILDHLSEGQSKRVTSVKRLERRLSRKGSQVDRPEIVRFFQRLHEIGLGEFASGEDGRRPRFLWGFPNAQLAQIANGEAWALEPMTDSVPEEEEGGDEESGEARESAEANGSSAIKHVFRLRENFSVKMRLPADLTANEAFRLADFFKPLPFCL
jgi:hypothetical protein